jgi:hypothetical protein
MTIEMVISVVLQLPSVNTVSTSISARTRVSLPNRVTSDTLAINRRRMRMSGLRRCLRDAKPLDIPKNTLDCEATIWGFPFGAMPAGGKGEIAAAGNRNSLRFARFGYTLLKSPALVARVVHSNHDVEAENGPLFHDSRIETIMYK